MPSNNVSIVRRAMNHISKPQVEKTVGQVMLSGGTIAAVGFFATKGVAVLTAASGAALAATGWGVIALVVAGLFFALHGAYRAHKAAQQEKAAQQASLANKKVEVEEIEMKNVVGEGFSQPKPEFEVKCKVMLPGQEPCDFEDLFEELAAKYSKSETRKTESEGSDTESVSGTESEASEAEPKVETYEEYLSYLGNLSLNPEKNKKEFDLLSEENQSIVRVFEALDPGLRCVDEFQARLEPLKGSENYSAVVAKAIEYLSQEEPEDLEDARNILTARAYLENERVSKDKTSESVKDSLDLEDAENIDETSERVKGSFDRFYIESPRKISASTIANFSLGVLALGASFAAAYKNPEMLMDLVGPAKEAILADFGFTRV